MLHYSYTEKNVFVHKSFTFTVHLEIHFRHPCSLCGMQLIQNTGKKEIKKREMKKLTSF